MFVDSVYFMWKVSLRYVFSRDNPHEKNGNDTVDITIQDISTQDTGADICGMLWNRRRYDTAVTSQQDASRVASHFKR